ncbi:hypothetical protein BDZ94DRAFT_1250943 [Collybia nuda]|uniref:Homeobox domain-containing protein n=1 Tax=Collybia nuda TaxID=64659 RepID=A0A9P6CLM2_9AGAR|nr:hypothetical protein BDZ94DRAFT_1250943 [Collybia nuda]
MADYEAYMDSKRVTLQLDTSSFIRIADTDDDNDSNNTSPDSTAPEHSPRLRPIHINTRPSSRGSESDDERDPASGPHRSRSVSSGKSDKEKRKRSRVTPEQLVHLERFFSVDRSPTAARRREISDLLGMQERQTQIWFQNRRAKAKLQDSKQKGRSGSAEVPPDSPPQLSTGFEADLQNLIHEDEPVTIIPCTDLSIGTWRRIATTVGKHDLVAYVCDIKKCLTWFIHSAGFGFKMEIPFDTIINTTFTNAAPGSGLASFQLSQPPIFYLENTGSPDTDGSSGRYWKRCSDWTEGHQASTVLHHELIGSAVQLSHVLRSLTAEKGTDIPLRYPSYRVEPPTSPMELPPPPMAGLTGPGYHYQPEVARSSPDCVHALISRKRSSYSGSILTSHSPDSAYSNDSDRPVPYNVPPGSSFSQPHSYTTQSNRDAPTVSDFSTPLYNDYTAEAHHIGGHHGQHVNDYTGVPISHGLAPRPYAAQPVPRTFYSEIPRLLHTVYDTADTQMHRSSSVPSVENHYLQPSPSPPLLTTPYHPPPHLLDNTNHSEGYQNHHNSITPPILTGLPPVYNDT